MADAATFTIKLESSTSGTSGGGSAPFPAGSPSSQPQKAFDPAALAQARRDAEIRRQQVNDAYAAMFPKPDEEQKQKSIFDRLFKPSSPEARAASGFASMGLGMAGMRSAAAVVGGYAAAGPAGAAFAAIDQVGRQLKEMAQAVMMPIANMDPRGLAHGFADLLEKIPVVGSIFGGLAKVTLGLSDAIDTTAKRLSSYSGALAVQQAMIDVRRIQRDIERAQRFGPQIQEAVEARFQLDQQLEDIINKHMGTILE